MKLTAELVKPNKPVARGMMDNVMEFSITMPWDLTKADYVTIQL